MGVVTVVAFFLRAFLVRRAVIAAENLALRQQLAVLQVSVKRPRLRKRDRVFWVWLAPAPGLISTCVCMGRSASRLDSCGSV
jgi:hypothetical protein